MSRAIEIRPAKKQDVAAVAPLAAELVRQHHRWDERRFFLLEDVEEGYRRWLGKELISKRVVLLVATRGDEIVGYLYGRLEPRDWSTLRDACGAVHDVFVAPAARRLGVATRLMQTASAWFKQHKAERVVLMSASQNVEGQALFRALGYRSTMVEMTLELETR
jgi:ribosomal protein S18 acetylase RimI-like enzyme